MNHVYVVLVCSEYGMPKISQEAYTSLEKAQKFIKDRHDWVTQVDDFNFKGRQYGYTIHELNLC